MLDFICNGSVDLFGTRRERKIQNENICLQRDSTHTTPVHDRKFSARSRGLDGDQHTCEPVASKMLEKFSGELAKKLENFVGLRYVKNVGK